MFYLSIFLGYGSVNRFFGVLSQWRVGSRDLLSSEKRKRENVTVFVTTPYEPRDCSDRPVNIATDHIVFSGLIEKITDYQPLHPSDVPKGKNVQIHNGAFYHSSNPSYPNVRTYTHFFLIRTNILYMRLWIEGSAFAF